MHKYAETNRERWDRRVAHNVSSASYDVEGFKEGKLSLSPVERRELTNVDGKSMLHLQCHFGLDSLSWARLGARVTGVDFSPLAIVAARSLAAEVGLEAKFICSNVYDLPAVLNAEFDIVFTSHGVLTWLPDLEKWSQVITHFLKSGGVFYIVEAHPFGGAFDNDDSATDLRIHHSYFHDDVPDRSESAIPSESDGEAADDVSYQWSHGIGDVITALASAGLHVEYVHEFPFAAYMRLPFMDRRDDGMWELPRLRECVPFLYSLLATKPAA